MSPPQQNATDVRKCRNRAWSRYQHCDISDDFGVFLFESIPCFIREILQSDCLLKCDTQTPVFEVDVLLGDECQL